MKNRMLAGVLIAVVIAGAACDSVSEPTQVPLNVTTWEIYEAYQMNEARANNDFKDRPLNLQYSVDEIEDKYVVQELGGFGLVQAQLEFREADLVRFNIGDTGQALCRLRGFDLDIWLRFDCR